MMRTHTGTRMDARQGLTWLMRLTMPPSARLEMTSREGDSVRSGVVVDSAEETGSPRVVEDATDMSGKVADVEVVSMTDGEAVGCIVTSAVGA